MNLLPLSRSILALCLVGSMAASAQTPLSVTQGRAAQRVGTQLVDVYYDIGGGEPPYSVTLEGSADGGATWSLPVTTVSGNVGNVDAEEKNLRVTWDAGTDWPEQLTENAKFRVNVTDTGGLDGFALIPAGFFLMGDNFAEHNDGELPVHSVNVSAFYMGKFEVTKSLWDSVRTWGAANGYTDLPTGGGKGANHPVHSISWHAMVKWCNARSQRDGLTPCYTVSGAVYRTGSNNAVECNWNANGYRLPTEAEWEKAARGGVSGRRFPWGDTISHARANFFVSGDCGIQSYELPPLDYAGWHPSYDNGNTPYSSPVGSFAPNSYGLYNMAGNMSELVWDWVGWDYYASSPSADPRGAPSGLGRMIRGGSWEDCVRNCRVAGRIGSSVPGYADYTIGFRLARSSIP